MDDDYNNLLNSYKDTRERHSVLQQYDKICRDDLSFDSHFTPECIKDSTKTPKKGKSSGNDI